MKLRAAELRGIKRNSSVAEYPPSLAFGELRKGYSPRLHPRSPAFVAVGYYGGVGQAAGYSAKENKNTAPL